MKGKTNKKRRARILALLLSLSILLSLSACLGEGGTPAGPAHTEKPEETRGESGAHDAETDGESAALPDKKDGETPAADPSRAEKLVEEICVDHGAYGAAASGRIEELLGELSSLDAVAAVRWRRIFDLWTSPRLGGELSYGVLPDGLPDTEELCIVVLGFQLSPDGSMQQELIERLTVALNSAKKYPNAYLLCTGGGTAMGNPSVTEAGEMAKWLAGQGVDPKRIIVEDKSITTAQNAIFAYDILTSLYPSVKKLAIVSSDYHIATGELVFEAEAILRANAPGNEKLEVVSNAAWKAPSGHLSVMFQAGTLIELSGDVKTAFAVYDEYYDIHALPPLH